MTYYALIQLAKDDILSDVSSSDNSTSSIKSKTPQKSSKSLSSATKFKQQNKTIEYASNASNTDINKSNSTWSTQSTGKVVPS